MKRRADKNWDAQQQRNQVLIDKSVYMRDEVVSHVLPLHIDIGKTEALSDEQQLALGALEIEAARTAIARRLGRPVDEILLLNGAAEGFWLLARTLKAKHAACVNPMFTEPEAALRASGMNVTRAFRNPETFALDTEAVPEEADLVVLCNPNNPTGNLDRATEVELLVRPGRTVPATAGGSSCWLLLPGRPGMRTPGRGQRRPR